MKQLETHAEQTPETDVEQRAERLLDVETHIKDSLTEEPTRERSLTINPRGRFQQLFTRTSQGELFTTFHSAPVTDATIDTSSYITTVTLTVSPDPDTHLDFTLPVPANTGDAHNPLVRLCRSQDIPVTRVADLNSVTLVINDHDQWRLVIPPQLRTHSYNLTVDNYQLIDDLQIPALSDYVYNLNHRLVKTLTAYLPHYRPEEYSDGTAGFDCPTKLAVRTHYASAFALALLISVAVVSTNLEPLILLTGFLWFVFTVAISQPFIIDREQSLLLKPD